MSLRRYVITCEHHGRIRTIVLREIFAFSVTDAINEFMNWHERHYPHRRVYNLTCTHNEIFSDF